MVLINRIRSEEVEYSLKLWILLVVFVLLVFSSAIELGVIPLISAHTDFLEPGTGASTECIAGELTAHWKVPINADRIIFSECSIINLNAKTCIQVNKFRAKEKAKAQYTHIGAKLAQLTNTS